MVKLVKKMIFVMVVIIILFVGFNMSYTEAQATDTVDEVMTGADNFLRSGSNEIVIKEIELQKTSNFIFNLLLSFAIIAAVIIGMIIGIQFMMAGVEEKAKIKESLMPYFVGCVVVFGAFGIWKLAVTIVSKL